MSRVGGGVKVSKSIKRGGVFKIQIRGGVSF